MKDTATLAPDLAARLTKILRREVDPGLPEANLVEAYEADSMDVVDIVEMIERVYVVKIPNDQLPSLRTFGDLMKIIQTPG